MADPAAGEDPLATLRGHVRSAQGAAERLAGMAARPPVADADGPGAPPSGWAAEDDRETTAELRALIDLVDSLRRALPEELREQLAEVIREMLLLLRAIIDWLVARIERENSTATPAEVEDIPIL